MGANDYVESPSASANRSLACAPTCDRLRRAMGLAGRSDGGRGRTRHAQGTRHLGTAGPQRRQGRRPLRSPHGRLGPGPRWRHPESARSHLLITPEAGGRPRAASADRHRTKGGLSAIRREAYQLAGEQAALISRYGFTGQDGRPDHAGATGRRRFVQTQTAAPLSAHAKVA